MATDSSTDRRGRNGNPQVARGRVPRGGRSGDHHHVPVHKELRSHEAGARLHWEWETYGVETDVDVLEVVADRLVRFTWNGYDRDRPTTVEFRFAPFGQRALASTGGFTFVVWFAHR
jgi:uncharacterized protein YndB with AHSA1/START domain